MKPLRPRGQGRGSLGLILALWISMAFPGVLRAHVGSSTVFFDGQIGPYQARVTVQPPEVIPGLATVNVRALSPGVQRVTALPIRWNTGRQGAPPPDIAKPVRGESNLYSAQLWFMQGGAQSVEVEVFGSEGSGKTILPVNAVATRVLPMPKPLAYLLFGLGSCLVLLLTVIVGAAVREGVLPPGIHPSRRRIWLARAATVTSAVVVLGLGFLGKRWWDLEAADYRNNRLFRPLEMTASVVSAPEGRTLRLEMTDEAVRRGAPLVPDHGKLLHLFVIREPDLDVFAHLHPQKKDWKTFEIPLPPWPAGRYTAYGDVTFETGFTDTLVARLTLDAPNDHGIPPKLALADPDDTWHQGVPLANSSVRVGQSHVLTDRPGGPITIESALEGVAAATRDVELRFRVHDGHGKPVALEPYLGMKAHLVLRKDDGSVFTHLHPGGSYSMAAQELFVMRGDGRAPLRVASITNDPICRLPASAELDALARTASLEETGQGGLIAFPYAFPKPGRYRLWFQVKVSGEIQTAVFDLDVPAGQGA